MKLADHYEVVCAGSGLSSYLCAALLARVGRKVLVVDDQYRAGIPESSRTEWFDSDFSVFTGLGPTGALGRSLRDIGLLSARSDGDTYLSDGFVPLNEITQLLSPDHRIAFWKDREQACHEIEREIKGASAQVCEFFSRLYEAGRQIPNFVEDAINPARGTSADVSAWKKYWGPYYGGLSRQVPLPFKQAIEGELGRICERFANAMLGTLSYSAPSNLGIEQALRGLSLLMQGVYFHVGGLEGLKSALSEVILASGGGVKRDARVESLITESGRITGVLLSSYEGIIRADVIVLAGRLRRLYASLPAGMQDPSLVRSLARVRPSSWRFTIAVTVEKNVIPLGASSHMTYVGSYQHPLEEENYLRIVTLPEQMTPAGVGKEETVILLTALVPYRASTLDYNYLRRLGGRMLRALSDLFPFLENSIRKVYPDVRSGGDMLREIYPFSGLDWLPENLLQYYVQGQRAVQDFWGPPWTTPHSNLYFAGRSIWPSLGTYGEALTARKIFDDIMLPTGGH